MIDDTIGASVSHDMERVFATLGGPSRRPATAPSRPMPIPDRPPVAQVRGTAMTARARHAVLAAAILLVAVAGCLIFVLTRDDGAAGRPAPGPSPAPVSPMHRAAPHAAALPAPEAISPGEARSDGARAATPVRHRAQGEMREPPSRRGGAAPAGARRSEARSAARATATRSCDAASDRARCDYDQLLAADRRVRQAYAAATAAGVPTEALRRARGSWKRALSRSGKDPLVSIGTLDGLTNSLRRSIPPAAGHAR